jgi:CheY-like chemotaxis protein
MSQAQESVSPKFVLCIDDDLPGLEIRRIFLETFGFQVLTATGGQEGLLLLTSHPVDLVILDYQMPGMNGEQVAAEIRHHWPQLPIVMLTGFAGLIPDSAEKLVNCIVDKGSPSADLIETIEGLIGSAIPPARSREQIIAEGRKTITRVRDHLQGQVQRRLRGHG